MRGMPVPQDRGMTSPCLAVAFRGTSFVVLTCAHRKHVACRIAAVAAMIYGNGIHKIICHASLAEPIEK